MKICLPVMETNGMEQEVHGHFGSAKVYYVYDTENQQLESIINPNSDHAHGACQPARALTGLNIDAIVTAGMGMKAVSILNQGGIKVYLFPGGTVRSAIDTLQEGKLKEMSSENACQHHDCGGH